ncbi:hypothetical protein MXB_775 [Myxobolus squamalis]|nr:hypothetical protein MXB_775 [Myxobolus squamalis]
MYALLIDSQLKTHKFSYYDIGLKNYWLPVKSIQPSEQTFRIYCNNDIVADADDIEIKFHENLNNNVIIDHIDQSEFQLNGLTQLAIDLRPTGCQEIDLKFKGPFDYEIYLVEYVLQI